MQSIKQLLKSNALTAHLISDYGYRTILFTFFALSFNTIAGIFKLCSAFVLHSLWYAVLGTYSVVLAAARYFLLRAAAQAAGIHNDAKRARLGTKIAQCSGRSLIVLALVFFGAVWQMVFAGQAFRYSGAWIVPAGGMALLKIIYALLQLRRVRRLTRRILVCIRQLNCADALVSLMSLQTAVFFALGEQVQPYQQVLNALSGTVVCIVIFAMGIQTALLARAEEAAGKAGGGRNRKSERYNQKR